MSNEISEHVLINITEESAGIPRLGFGTLMIASCNATFPERARTYTGLADMVDDGFSSTSPEYRAARAAFSQKPRPVSIKIGRLVGKPTLINLVTVALVAEGAAYAATVKGTGITDTTVSYTALSDLTFTALNAGDVFTSVAHGMTTGDGPYRMTGGSIPTGTAVDGWGMAIRIARGKGQAETAQAARHTPTGQPSQIAGPDSAPSLNIYADR